MFCRTMRMLGRARSSGCSPLLRTLEPPIVDRDIVRYAERDKSWRDERMAMVNDRIRARLGELSARLGDADWLEGAFSAADIMMVHVLRRLEGSGSCVRLHLRRAFTHSEVGPQSHAGECAAVGDKRRPHKRYHQPMRHGASPTTARSIKITPLDSTAGP